MGYCSYVALCLSPVGEEEFRKEYNASLEFSPGSALSEVKPEDSLLNYPDEHYEKHGATLRIWEEVKWYEDEFAELRFIHDFIGDHWDDCLLLRFGEELDDSEREGSYFENPFGLCIRRSFGFEVAPGVSLKHTHLFVCLSPEGERLFLKECDSALAKLPGPQKTAWECLVNKTAILVHERKLIRCYSTSNPAFSLWLNDILHGFIMQAQATDYYLISTGKGPTRSSEKGLLFDVPQGASLMDVDHNLAPFLRFLMN